jgi:hypothetical protein
MIKKIMIWFALTGMVGFFAMTVYLRLLNIDITILRSMVTYWPDYLITYAGLILSIFLYARAQNIHD